MLEREIILYLRKGYFAEKGPHPADDIGQGYLTITIPAKEDELPPEVLDAAKSDPEILEQFRPDPELMEAVTAEPHPDGFELFRNDEVAFDGTSDCGYIGYGLDIAFSEQAGVALVTYTGPDMPSVVRRYVCTSAEEAATMWEADWAEPLIFAEDFEDELPSTIH
jgi:hypothetical protein